ncbi:MAG: hypothetical protein KJZ74_10995 [Gemmatimonadales bacterium]|nr:hypothetical protein [Gemmatimonadales bacterium]
MTSTDRIRRARTTLALALAARALLVAVASALAVVAVGVVVDSVAGLPLTLRELLLPAALLTGAAVFASLFLLRVRGAWRATDEDVALWLEGRIPSLRYALVTSLGAPESPAARALADEVASAPVERTVRQASGHALWRPGVVALVLLGLVALAPPGAVARVTAPEAGDLLARAGGAARAERDPLATIVVRVSPPAYTGLPARTFEDPSAVPALAGSRVTVEGLGAGVRAIVGSDTVRATTRTSAREGSPPGWVVALAVPAQPGAVRLLGPARERLFLIDPYADSVPTARLDLPARDSVLREARGDLALAAEFRDDLGLAEGAFEYIISAGAGETFTFRSGRVAARRFDAGVRVARIAGVLPLDSLRLGAGDLIHLRAVATDRNDVTGPGTGASETRTIRVARPDEYDSVAVDPMPPTEPEKNALSQRMILQMTQELHARAPRLAAPVLQRESRAIALEQTRLRKRVGEVVFLRLGEGEGGEHAHFAGDGHAHGEEGPVDAEGILAAAERAANAGATRMLESEGDETPIVAINRPLLEAYNHMWRAATELETARPGEAIPWMERAIEALQRARAAERIYLRGRPARVVVDLAKVRGTGKERGSLVIRDPREPLDAEREARLARFDRALDVVRADPGAAADTILLVRVSLPADDRATARALDAAADALRRGGDVTAPLQAARRALAGPPVRAGALLPWGG